MIESPITVLSVLSFAVTALTALVIWGVKLIATGRLVHKDTVEALFKNLKESYDRKSKEADEYKSLYESERRINSQISRGNSDILLEVAGTMTNVLRALPSGDDSGGESS